MGSPYFTTGPVAPAKDPMPGPVPGPVPGPLPTYPVKSPYANPAQPGDASVPPLPLMPPGKATTQLDTPYELTASAAIARQTATDLDDANGKAGPGAHSLTEYASTASTKIRGFSFGGALTGSTERWLQQCKTLHGKLGNAATSLDRTRQFYNANETSIATDFRAGR